MQGWGILRISMRLYQDFNILIECHEKTQKALDGKLPELAAQHLGYIRLTDAEEICRLDLFQAAPFHECVDLENKLCLNEMFVRIRHTEILEHVSAAVFTSLFAHGILSLAICSASRSRCFTSSRSRRAVSRPVFDFFWKA